MTMELRSLLDIDDNYFPSSFMVEEKKSYQPIPTRGQYDFDAIEKGSEKPLITSQPRIHSNSKPIQFISSAEESFKGCNQSSAMICDQCSNGISPPGSSSSSDSFRNSPSTNPRNTFLSTSKSNLLSMKQSWKSDIDLVCSSVAACLWFSFVEFFA